MRCVFCGTDWDIDTIVCPRCKEYKGMEPIETSKAVLLATALDKAMALMEQAREHYKQECEHPNLKHADSSAHLAFCPDCELEFECVCSEGGETNG